MKLCGIGMCDETMKVDVYANTEMPVWLLNKIWDTADPSRIEWQCSYWTGYKFHEKGSFNKKEKEHASRLIDPQRSPADK